jgi:hypothetical protein
MARVSPKRRATVVVGHPPTVAAVQNTQDEDLLAARTVGRLIRGAR